MAGLAAYLLDTNIFLELLLGQEESGSVKSFLTRTAPDELAVSDLAFHSIGIILYQKNSARLFSEFVRDLFSDGGIAILGLGSSDMTRVEEAATAFRLDFDDAYQYVVAEKFNLALVSFDMDFDRTDKKRMVPAEIR
ncbi:MAG: PIN domain-containing protein [Methanoregula sp.]